MSSADELTADNLYRDPYPVYARLRRDAPVCQFPETGEWLVTRAKDCQTVGAKDGIFGPSDSSLRPEARVMGMPNVLSMKGQEHASLRKGIDANLRPEMVDGYADGLIRPIVRKYIDAIRGRGQADLTTELFEPISVRVIGDFIGLQAVDNETLTRWFHALNGGLQNVANKADVWDVCDLARKEIDDVLRPIVERVSHTADNSLVSHVVHGGMPEGKTRSFEDIMPTIRVILLGGLQEPGHAAANATYGLLLDPRQSAALEADPAGLAQRAYDEGLRWIAPIGVTPRIAGEDFELAGTVIPKGASVAIVLASANRDEALYETPDKFDMNRQRKQHVAFGYRPHACSGSFLSRAFGKITMEEVFRSFPNLRLDPDGEVKTKGWRFRGVMNLPARWDA